MEIDSFEIVKCNIVVKSYFYSIIVYIIHVG
jgi:hypothetical protein